MIDQRTIASNIRWCRKKYNISMDDVEQKLNIDQIRQYDIETGSVIPTLKELAAYAGMFRVTMDDLISKGMMKADRKIKCRDYNACKRACQDCDIMLVPGCEKEFRFNTAEGAVRITGKDHMNASIIVCPTCGNNIGYRPEISTFRCTVCSQLIDWNVREEK